MRDLDCGVLPVCDNERILGMVTDRDIVVRAIAEHREPKRCRVSQVMTPRVHCCFEEDDAHEAARIMEHYQVRRLAVLDRSKRLVGIVSLGDLALEAHDHELEGEILERVSETHAKKAA